MVLKWVDRCDVKVEEFGAGDENDDDNSNIFWVKMLNPQVASGISGRSTEEEAVFNKI